MPDDAPKLHIDADWKEQAQAEKEKLSQKIDDSPRQPGPDELPPADMRALVGSLASQALMGLGAYADPQTGRAMIDLMGSRFAIDLLGVLEEKTKGNLNEEEAKAVQGTVSELRMHFVTVQQAVAKAVAEGRIKPQQAGVGGIGGGMGAGPKGPTLVGG